MEPCRAAVDVWDSETAGEGVDDAACRKDRRTGVDGPATGGAGGAATLIDVNEVVGSAAGDTAGRAPGKGKAGGAEGEAPWYSIP